MGLVLDSILRVKESKERREREKKKRVRDEKKEEEVRRGGEREKWRKYVRQR